MKRSIDFYIGSLFESSGETAISFITFTDICQYFARSKEIEFSQLSKNLQKMFIRYFPGNGVTPDALTLAKNLPSMFLAKDMQLSVDNPLHLLFQREHIRARHVNLRPPPNQLSEPLWNALTSSFLSTILRCYAMLRFPSNDLLPNSVITPILSYLKSSDLSSDQVVVYLTYLNDLAVWDRSSPTIQEAFMSMLFTRFENASYIKHRVSTFSEVKGQKFLSFTRYLFLLSKFFHIDYPSSEESATVTSDDGSFTKEINANRSDSLKDLRSSLILSISSTENRRAFFENLFQSIEFFLPNMAANDLKTVLITFREVS